MSDDVTDITNAILINIQTDLRALRADMDRRFDAVDRRFDDLIGVFGAAFRSHDERIVKIERHLETSDQRPKP